LTAVKARPGGAVKHARSIATGKIAMSNLAENWFPYLVLVSMIVFLLALTIVSITDARHGA